jgi:hypothetical protein
MTLHQPDLFKYPIQPGHKAGGTSCAAAEAIAPRAPTLRDQVHALLKNAALTADEAAARLDKSILSIRPRLSELLAQGKIQDTGKTRRNSSGVQATVWKAVA